MKTRRAISRLGGRHPNLLAQDRVLGPVVRCPLTRDTWLGRDRPLPAQALPPFGPCSALAGSPNAGLRGSGPGSAVSPAGAAAGGTAAPPAALLPGGGGAAPGPLAGEGGGGGGDRPG